MNYVILLENIVANCLTVSTLVIGIGHILYNLIKTLKTFLRLFALAIQWLYNIISRVSDYFAQFEIRNKSEFQVFISLLL